MNLNMIHDVFIYACSEDLMEDQAPMKRHSDAIFTDNYSRFRKQMAVKKYLNSVLSGKRRYTFSVLGFDKSFTQRCVNTQKQRC